MTMQLLQKPQQTAGPRRRNHPAEEHLADVLEALVAAAEAVLDAHGTGCTCDLCHDVSGLWYQAGLFSSIVDCQLIPRRRQVEADLADVIETAATAAN